MVNEITHTPVFAPALGQHSCAEEQMTAFSMHPDVSPQRYDLFLEDRSRILITQVEPNQRVRSSCHIHASKQITVLDGYAEVALSGKCIKLFEGQTMNIPNGTVHKIVNFGEISLKYVEIRTGPYVLDDDLLSY